MNIEEIKTSVETLVTSTADFQKKYDDKLEALDKEVLDMQKKANRLPGGYQGDKSDMAESRKALADYIRSRGEVKAGFSADGPTGGWTVQPVFQKGIASILRNNSALRQLVNFVQMDSGDSFEELLSISAAGASWVGEQSPRTETTSPALVKIMTPLLELYAAPTLSQRLADDSGTNMVDWLINEVGVSFSEAEEGTLFLGDGILAPRGLDTITTAATGDLTRTFGTIQHVFTGTSGAFDSAAPLDKIKETFYSLKEGYRKNSKWVCSSATALAISKLKDADGHGYWDSGNIQSGQPISLFGREVVICEATPAIAANSKSLWLADWNQAMRGIERMGNKVLLDPYSNKPNLVVYIYRRIGFSLRNSSAIKCLKFSTS